MFIFFAYQMHVIFPLKASKDHVQKWFKVAF